MGEEHESGELYYLGTGLSMSSLASISQAFA